jgi:CheY-like chemotaxis protein/anti-sigma regulatory factor (Ser/Thr protein kinase)
MRGRASARELEILERQARHLVRLVDDLLDVSRITSGKFSLQHASVDVADVLAQAVESTTQAFEQKGVRFLRGHAPPGLSIEGDRERLVQVVTNLLANAVKFTPAGRAVHLSARQDGEEIVIAVRDEGEGIAPELLPQVFDIFTQGEQGRDRRSGGLGLGLAIARSVVVAHGGRITAMSDGLGRGAAFEVRLPLPPAAWMVDTRPDAPTPVTHARTRRRILVVDDSADGVEMLAEFLGAIGYEAVVAYRAPEALAIARELPLDAAILDIGLPDMDGYELARTIKAELQARAPKLVAMTGYAQPADRARAFEAGFAEHLAKPVDMTVLASTLERVLA